MNPQEVGEIRAKIPEWRELATHEKYTFDRLIVVQLVSYVDHLERELKGVGVIMAAVHAPFGGVDD